MGLAMLHVHPISGWIQRALEPTVSYSSGMDRMEDISEALGNDIPRRRVLLSLSHGVIVGGLQLCSS